MNMYVPIYKLSKCEVMGNKVYKWFANTAAYFYSQKIMYPPRILMINPI